VYVVGFLVGRSVGIWFCFKQRTVDECGTGYWSSDVCSSDLVNEWNSTVGKVVGIQVAIIGE